MIKLLVFVHFIVQWVIACQHNQQLQHCRQTAKHYNTHSRKTQPLCVVIAICAKIRTSERIKTNPRVYGGIVKW